MAKKILIHDVSEPLSGVTRATIDINTGMGNLMIDTLPTTEPVLASGTLEYMEGQDPPMPAVSMADGSATLTLKAEGGRQPSFRMPWSACNGETTWQIHLHPTVSADITAYSGGGNVQLNLAGMPVTRLVANSGGGNLDVVLPDHATSLSVSARTGGGNVTVEIGADTHGSNVLDAQSGAGNVMVHVPNGIAARIHAATGLGKVIVDPQFNRLDRDIYQSPDYDTAADKVEITLHSGAGNVIVNSK